MALETVVIKITGDSKELDATIDKIQKVGIVDKKNAESFKKTSKSMGSGFEFLTKKAIALGSAMLGAFAIQQIVGNAINTLKDFEKELSTLQSITGSTAKEMEFFKKAAHDVGQETKTSATEVVKAFTMIGSAQPELLKNGAALAEVTKQALILSKAAGIDATSAATALTSAMNQFGVKAKDAAKFTDIFATSQQKGSSFIADTSEALINSGAAASAAGLTFETTNAAIQALAKGAIVGARAGTALRGVLSKLSAQSDDKINPSLEGLGDTITELAKRNLTLKDATKLVGEEGATGLLTLIKQKDIFFELDGALNDVGNAMAQMETNTNNLDGSLEELGNAWEGWITQLSGSDGVLKDTTDAFADFLVVLTEKGLIDALVGFAGSAWGVQHAQLEMIKVEKSLAARQSERIGIIKELATLSEDYQKNQDVVNVTQKEATELTRKANAVQNVTEKLFHEAIITRDQYMHSMNGVSLVLEGHLKIQKELNEEQKLETNTVGSLKKEKQELLKAQDGLIRGSKELAENKRAIKKINKELSGSTRKSTTAFERLQKVITTLRKKLQDQALAGDLDEKTLAKLKTSTTKLEAAQKLLDDATGKATKAIKEQQELAPDDDTHAEEMKARDEEDRRLFLSKELQGRFAQEAIQLAKDTGQTKEEIAEEFARSEFETFKEFEEAKRDEINKTSDEDKAAQEERFQKISDAINLISDVEQEASAIFAQINENKLIAIDNEEKRALKSLEEQGLGEEELADKQKEIQENAAEERAKIMHKQAIADKASAIAQATMRTALAVVSALAMLPPNIPLSILVGVLGAAQVAAIAAQPIPEFHEGKKAELKDGEIFAKVLKSESVIPPEQSKKYKGAIDSMIDKKFENYVFQEYMLPMMKSMGKKDPTPYDDVHVWNNQKKQIKLMQESNGLTKLMIKTLDHTNHRRTWNG